MGYALRDIEDFSEQDLHKELARRLKDRQAGLCDFCGRPPMTAPCREFERHVATKAPAKKTAPPNGKDDRTAPPKGDGDEVRQRLVRWLLDHPEDLAYLAVHLNLALRTCEGFEGPCAKFAIRYTSAATSYAWDGDGVDPNREQCLCPECAEAYLAHWKAMWDEYYASVRPVDL